MSEKTYGHFNDDEMLTNKVLWKGCGYSDDDLDRPIIGIANSFNDMVPGHTSLRDLAEQVKYGIYRAGGTPAEFGVIACCDGVATGHIGNNYALPSRDNIADSIEIQARAHKLDGLVLLGSCDKIVPGMLMAAARLDIPAIFVAGGCMAGGPPFANRTRSDSTTITEAIGMYQTGHASYEDLQNLTTVACPTCGSCQFMGTANTMCAEAEALGMSLTGSAFIPAFYNERLRSALQSGEKIVELVKCGITARQIMTMDAIRNAIRILMAVGGSTNAVIHTCALAWELGIDPALIMDEFEHISNEIPHIAKISPASVVYDSEDLYKAGGIPEVMKIIKDSLALDVMTVTGQTLGANLEHYKNCYAPNPEIIRPLDNPHSTLGGLAIMRGNLAPDTGVAKPAAIAEEARHFTGTAICFDSEEECTEAIRQRRIKAGHVVIIRYEGPKGGPGMREMYQPLKMLYGQGLNKTTAVVTDGRFSGTNNGCFVGHVSPEAAAGGPIALVRDGDQINIDVYKKELTLHVSDEELARRKAEWTYEPKPASGYLKRYSRLAASADKGGVLLC
ncbi:MAG: dihydroxy-acid dehydratase [Lachnospiraceae bacterium]|nr:dihydroxy-acid dehydratase [Lachnospiraceae bacterium]